MRRHAMFGKGRSFRVDDNQVQDLNLEPGQGAAIGEYAHPESSEYSDSYYGPGRESRKSSDQNDLNRGVTGRFRGRDGGGIAGHEVLDLHVVGSLSE